MSELITYEPTVEHFGVFGKYIAEPSVTDIDYNGTSLWITDFERGRYEVKEEITEQFLSSFTHSISNCVNKQFNNANKVLEADTKELRISIIHNFTKHTFISSTSSFTRQPLIIHSKLNNNKINIIIYNMIFHTSNCKRRISSTNTFI